MTAAPYPDETAYLHDELRRLDCRLRAEVDRFEGPIDQFGALYISEEEVRALLDGAAVDDGCTGAPAGEVLEERRAAIDDRRRATREDGRRLRFDALVERFGLDEHGRELLLSALAPELEGRYATIYAFLQDDATRTFPTVDFLVGLLADEADRLVLRSHFAADAPLVDHGLVTLDGNGPRTRQTVRPDRRIVQYLLEGSGLDPALEPVATLIEPESDDGTDAPTIGRDGRRETARPREGDGKLDPSRDGDGEADRPGNMYPEVDRPPDGNGETVPSRIDDLVGSGTVPADPPAIVAVHGPPGSGVEAVAERLAPPSSLLRVDAATLAQSSSRVLDTVLRETRLLDATLQVTGLSTTTEEFARDVFRAVDRLDGPVLLADTEEPPGGVHSVLEEHVVVPVEVPRPSYPERRERWRSVPDLPDGIDPEAIAGTFRLSAGQIEDAMARARSQARLSGEALSADHVNEACRAQSGGELAELARTIDPEYDWEDIVLPSETERRLRELAGRLKQRGAVYEEWGFGTASRRGMGVVGLFSGPSGTGKTMAAEVVANDAGLDLYRVDLSTVVSKYVGETESNLGRIFDAAADTDAALLFDEADALFGERSEVGDAQDRYANIEVDYLLQRIEEHDGVVLLTSNLESNIDDAFLRRIHVSVEFPTPERGARREIWRRVVPPDAPTEDLDVDFLARFELTGGNIRNVALGAAFLAAEGNEPIAMGHLVRSLQREFEKTGRLIDPDQFGPYRELLEDG